MDIDVADLYAPLPSQNAFHTSQAKFRAYIGGFGSGKTKSGCWEAIEQSMLFPGNLGIICRNTMPELRDTTMRSFFEECPPELIRSHHQTNKHVIFHNGSEILFKSLDEPAKFKSLNLGWYFIDEASDTEEEAFLILNSRLRYLKVPPGGHTGFITSNPSTVKHWLYQRFADNPTNEYELFRAPTSENPYLPKGYEDSLRAMFDENWVRRYLDGEFGFVAEGTPVYPEFKHSRHVRQVVYNPALPIIRGWDFGLHHPACVICQIQDNRLYILQEISGDKELIEDFAARVRGICNTEYKAYMYQDYCDPAGNQKSDKTLKTSVQILRSQGIYAISRPQHILDGVQLIRMMLHKIQKDGNPSLLIHPSCTNLIEGLMGGYHYPKKYKGSGEDPKPEKDGNYDHSQDALRYLAINSEFKSWLNKPAAKQEDEAGSFNFWMKRAGQKGATYRV